MKTSEKGIELIKYFESLHDGDLTKVGLQPKLCPAGIWTEGYGHAMTDDHGRFISGKNASQAQADLLSKVKTKEDATKLLVKDLNKFEAIVNKRLKVEVKQNEYDALVSHTFNTGGSDTLFDLVNKKSTTEELKNWFLNKYISANGVVLKGLQRRRMSEFVLFTTGELKF